MEMQYEERVGRRGLREKTERGGEHLWGMLETWDWVVFPPPYFLSEKLNYNCENDMYPLNKNLSSHLKTKQMFMIGPHVKNHNFCLVHSD